jgi:Ca2+-binding RTX toxin-like protein
MDTSLLIDAATTDKLLIDGTTKKDDIVGTSADDFIRAWDGGDRIEGLDGNDVIFGWSGDDRIFGGNGDDYIDAGSGDDYISDGDGNDIVYGGEGNDYVKAGRGDDTYHGGKGFDTIDFGNAKNGLVADLSKGIVTGRGTDIVQGFEKFIGSKFADTIKGSNDAEVIEAGQGENIIRSLGGADTISGGFDRDTFVYRTSDVISTTGVHLGVDTVLGFETNDAFDISGMLSASQRADLNNNVRMVDNDAGFTLQVKVNGTFVDVADVIGCSAGGASATAWASDGLLLVG